MDTAHNEREVRKTVLSIENINERLWIERNKKDKCRTLACDILAMAKEREFCLCEFQRTIKLCENALSLIPAAVDDVEIVYRLV